MELPILGTTEKMKSSRYQVTLVDMTDKNIRPLDYPRTNRFFEYLGDRNSFVTAFETSIMKAGGKLVLNDKLTHPLFSSFAVIDNRGTKNYEITVYH